MDQSDDNSLMALLTKKDQVRFRKIVNTCTERQAEKRIQRTVWILSHVLRTTLCEHVNGLCPAGWLSEQSITKHWFQSVRTCPYSSATGRNTINIWIDFPLRLAGVSYILVIKNVKMPARIFTNLVNKRSDAIGFDYRSSFGNLPNSEPTVWTAMN